VAIASSENQLIVRSIFETKEVIMMINEKKCNAIMDMEHPIICINRSVSPKYPDFVKKLANPELELQGPTSFLVTKLSLWLHPIQEGKLKAVAYDEERDDAARGYDIYKYLEKNKMLESCCNLVDLKAIQDRGIVFFRKYFDKKFVFGWGSVVVDNRGYLVPYLYTDSVRVKLGWRYLSDYFVFRDFALLMLRN